MFFLLDCFSATPSPLYKSHPPRPSLRLNDLGGLVAELSASGFAVVQRCASGSPYAHVLPLSQTMLPSGWIVPLSNCAGLWSKRTSMEFGGINLPDPRTLPWNGVTETSTATWYHSVFLGLWVGSEYHPPRGTTEAREGQAPPICVSCGLSWVGPG